MAAIARWLVEPRAALRLPHSARGDGDGAAWLAGRRTERLRLHGVLREQRVRKKAQLLELASLLDRRRRCARKKGIRQMHYWTWWRKLWFYMLNPTKRGPWSK